MKRCRWLTAILVCLLLSGCWDVIDIDKRVFVIAIGVDPGRQRRLTLSAKIAIPRNIASIGGAGGGAGGPKFEFVQREGEDLAEAEKGLSRMKAGRFSMSEVKMVMIGEDAARASIEPIIDHVKRDREVRHTAYVAIARPSAAAVLGKRVADERLPINYLTELFDKAWAEDESEVLSRHLWQAYAALYNPARDVVLPVMTVTGDGKVTTDGTAIFRGDRLAGFLTPRQTTYLKLLTQGLSNTRLSVTDRRGRPPVQLYLQSGHASLRPAADRNNYQMDIDITLNVFLSEQPEGAEGMPVPALEALTNRRVEREVGDLIRTLQAANSDVLGFGDRFRRLLPDVISAGGWRRLFPKLQVSVRVNTVIRSTGFVK